ncbi:MAG: hypothetical protein R6V20_01225 [Desulfobia sp.]
MIKISLTSVIVVSSLILLPLIGVFLAGEPLRRYLEFPPATSYVEHAPFSWPLFFFLAFFILAVLAPFVLRFLRYQKRTNRLISDSVQSERSKFPWWGWAGLFLIMVSWLLAWNRFSWFSPLQPYTYFPLWLGYILTVNGLCQSRTSESLLSRNPAFFLALFPLSGVFWWYFEYLNRFVQNWHYLGIADFSTTEYVIHATVCFSTVLPAVLSTKELLEGFPALLRPFETWIPFDLFKESRGRKIAGLIFIIIVLALVLLPLLPEYLFPFLWISPLFILSGFQVLRGEKTIFAPLKKGDWRIIVSSTLAALICGFFWEMWNWQSLAHWEYSISFVQRFHLFEMPILGYAGYLPFGLECVIVAQFFKKIADHELKEIIHY